MLISQSRSFNIDLNALSRNGFTALHEACYYGRSRVAERLLHSSDAFEIDLNVMIDDGWTAFHLAAFCLSSLIMAQLCPDLRFVLALHSETKK